MTHASLHVWAFSRMPVSRFGGGQELTVLPTSAMHLPMCGSVDKGTQHARMNRGCWGVCMSSALCDGCTLKVYTHVHDGLERPRMGVSAHQTRGTWVSVAHTIPGGQLVPWLSLLGSMRLFTWLYPPPQSEAWPGHKHLSGPQERAGQNSHCPGPG